MNHKNALAVETKRNEVVVIKQLLFVVVVAVVGIVGLVSFT